MADSAQRDTYPQQHLSSASGARRLMGNENLYTPRRPRSSALVEWSKGLRSEVHYKAINARYKAVRMRGNYLRTNQPKPGQLSIKKSSTSGPNGSAACNLQTQYSLRTLDCLSLFLSFTVIEKYVRRTYSRVQKFST